MKTAVAIASAADHAIGRNLSTGVTMSVPETLDTASRNQQFGSPQDIRPPRPKRSLTILPPARTLPRERTVSHSLGSLSLGRLPARLLGAGCTVDVMEQPELWISSVFFWNAPNGVWHDDFADFDLWLRQNIGSQT